MLHLVLAALLAGAPGVPVQLPKLNRGSHNSRNVALRVCPGGCGANLQGSLGEGVTFTRASAWTCPNLDGSVTALATGVPCLSSPVLGGPAFGYRARAAVTNTSQQSTVGAAPWNAQHAGACSNPVATANTTDVTAPDGTNTATKLVFSACGTIANGNFGIWADNAFTATAAAWTGSIWVRTLSGNCTQYFDFDGPPQSVQFTATPTWQRISLTKTLTAVAWNIELGANFNTGTDQTVATSACTLYAWGGQSEVGSVASDLCVTAGASATCNAETAVTTSSVSFPGTGSVFSMAADVNVYNFNAQGEVVMACNSSASDYAQIEMNTAGTINCSMRNGGSIPSLNSTAACTLNTPCHVKCVYDGANLTACVNGQCNSTASVFSFASTTYPVDVGYFCGGGFQLAGSETNVCVSRSIWGCP